MWWTAQGDHSVNIGMWRSGRMEAVDMEFLPPGSEGIFLVQAVVVCQRQTVPMPLSQR